MGIVYDNSRSNLNIIAPNHNEFDLYQKQKGTTCSFGLATLAFWTIKSRRTNTDVVPINNNTSTVIMAG